MILLQYGSGPYAYMWTCSLFCLNLRVCGLTKFIECPRQFAGRGISCREILFSCSKACPSWSACYIHSSRTPSTLVTAYIYRKWSMGCLGWFVSHFLIIYFVYDPICVSLLITAPHIQVWMSTVDGRILYLLPLYTSFFGPSSILTSFIFPRSDIVLSMTTAFLRLLSDRWDAADFTVRWKARSITTRIPTGVPIDSSLQRLSWAGRRALQSLMSTSL